MQIDGNELMDEESFEKFKEIVSVYSIEFARDMTLENLPEIRKLLNAIIPKDK